MKILFLAPQPFFQERGTPIAVRLALEVLATRAHAPVEIELLTYHEGEEVSIPGVTIHRIPKVPFLSGIGAGISVKKLFCDLLFFGKALWFGITRSYDLIHAVEESVFIALLLKVLKKTPYVYDMDSSLALQVTEKWWLLRWLRPLLEYCESQAIRGSLAVVPVCDALAVLAEKRGSRETHIVRDVSLLRSSTQGEPSSFREELGLKKEDIVVLYVGNLERYQGIDLLVESMNQVRMHAKNVHLVVIGGNPRDVERYQEKVRTLGAEGSMHFLGAKPVAHLHSYISEAQILAAPRVLGNNTPMKVYSYLHSGVPMVATNIPSHTQVLDDEVAVLTLPEPQAYAEGVLRLVQDSELRKKVGTAAFTRAHELYTFEVFQSKFNDLYDRLGVLVHSHRQLNDTVS